MFENMLKLFKAKDLVSHLLCVDPAQRYTIDQFLNHPWCNEAPAPPPPPTPLTAPILGRDHVIDSPLLQSLRGGREARSPGLATLKEAFDITYAVHRMEEEGARRRAYNGPGGAGTRGFLHGLNESDEDREIGDQDVVRQARRKEQSSKHVDATTKRRSRDVTELADGRAGMRDVPRRRDHEHASKPFELDLDNATLLGRRHRRVRAPGASSPLAQGGVTVGLQNMPRDVPGSPMQIG